MSMPDIAPDVLRRLRKKAARDRIGAVMVPLAGVYAIVAGLIAVCMLAAAVAERRTVQEILAAFLQVILTSALLMAPLLLLFVLVGGRLFQRLIIVRGVLAGKRADAALTHRSRQRFYVLKWSLYDCEAWRLGSNNQLGERVTAPTMIEVGRVERDGETTPEFDAAEVGRQVTLLCWSNGDLVGVIDVHG